MITSQYMPGTGKNAGGPDGFFTLQKQDRDSEARAGLVTTAHGTFQTPVFMPVGTQATVKTLTPRDLEEAGAEIILCNTYHLYLRPGEKLVADLGGLHAFMGWDHPILSDSGGYQVFSLADLSRIEPDGVTFQSHWDGSRHFFSPEKVIGIQQTLGVDIMMCLDECTPYPCDYEYARTSHQTTLAWAGRCREAQAKERGTTSSTLFGIVQGSVYEDLRRQNAEALVAMDFGGYAVGGLAVGEPKETMYAMLEAVLPILPAAKPRYLMGLGTPEDLVQCVARGVDMFDCVIPTRNGRNGTVYTADGRLVIKNADYRDDAEPIERDCHCYTCRHFSRAYLRHLFQCGEMLGPRLATLHNIHFFVNLMRQMRQAIINDDFGTWQERFRSRYQATSPSADTKTSE